MAGKSAAVALLLAAAGCASVEEGPDVEAASAYLEEGRAAAAKGDHAGAVNLYTSAIKANPEFPTAYYGRGYSRVRLRLDPDSRVPGRELEELALRDYSMAIRYNPAYANAYYNRAMIFNSRAQYRNAARDLLNAIRFNPEDPEAHYELGKLYEEKFEGKKIDALQHYERYVDLGGTDEKTRETVRLWKQLKTQSEAPPPANPPSAEDEDSAAKRHEEFKRHMLDGNRDEAIRAMSDLMGKYAHTRYVRSREREFRAVLNALKK